MASRRVDVRAILADPDLRRKLMVNALRAKQSREGIHTTEAQAERAYYVVTEGERAAFFALEQFKGGKGEPDRRHEAFVEALRGEVERVRFDVARRDFAAIELSPLAYQNIGIAGVWFREFPPLATAWASVQGGMNATESARFLRQRWEVASSHRRWTTYSKGGAYSRFYADLDIVIDWTNDGADYKAVVEKKYGSASRFVKSEDYYGRQGVTWTEMTSKGLNARRLPAGVVFNCKGPCAFPLRQDDHDFILAVLNANVAQFVMNCLTSRSYGSTYVGRVPIPKAEPRFHAVIGHLARSIHDAKATWDEGNEISTRFRAPWILRDDLVPACATIPERLDALARHEAAEDARIQGLYAELNDEVYKLYGVPEPTRAIIEETLGERPPELIWPQLERKTVPQKRMEHVWRLLSHVVRRVVDADEDGIVPFSPVGGEASLLDRVLADLATLFPSHDPRQVEVDIANELKRKVKGYRGVPTIGRWLDDVFFAHHVSLYKKRPVLWHIASAQGTTPFAFGAIVHYHRFGRDGMAKLRGGYLRDAIESFRREAGLADKEGRADDRAEWQARVEEAQALDRALQRVQEGHADGPEGGPTDFRILTPWKRSEQRPTGWDPDLDDGVKVNIEPLVKAGVLRVAKVT